jgi:3-deoxy-D-manno-octulosonate cytidylyltransferase
MSVTALIPARFASTRLPGKPLLDINGKSMIRRVYENAVKAGCLKSVIVLTDDERIEAEVFSFGGKVLMTDPEAASGTDRIVSVLPKLPKTDAYLNLQGDEPLMPPEFIRSLCTVFLSDPSAQVGTLVYVPQDRSELSNPAKVKVVLDNHGNGIYFSREAIPYIRDVPPAAWDLALFRLHIGVYIFRRRALSEYTRLGKSKLEELEKLEQLRWVANGYRIKCVTVGHGTTGVDTAEDLDQVRHILN